MLRAERTLITNFNQILKMCRNSFSQPVFFIETLLSLHFSFLWFYWLYVLWVWSLLYLSVRFWRVPTVAYDMATASSRAESSHNHRGTTQLHAIGESRTLYWNCSVAWPCPFPGELMLNHCVSEWYCQLYREFVKCLRGKNHYILLTSLYVHTTSVLCQNQEEEEPVWDSHLCGGDSGGAVAPHSKVSQLLQS